MREIKFRAWVKNEMAYFHPLGVSSPDGFWKKDGAENYRVFAERDADVNGYNHDDFNEEVQAVLMQYTGLKDKNGKEIYEGDIVQILPKNRTTYYSRMNTFVVEYMELDNCGDCTEDSGIGFNFYLKDPSEDLEVIGNIYENPELLN